MGAKQSNQAWLPLAATGISEVALPPVDNSLYNTNNNSIGNNSFSLQQFLYDEESRPVFRKYVKDKCMSEELLMFHDDYVKFKYQYVSSSSSMNFDDQQTVHSQLQDNTAMHPFQQGDLLSLMSSKFHGKAHLGETLPQSALYIVQQYVDTKSKRSINLSDETKYKILDRITTGKINGDMFDEMYENVISQLKNIHLSFVNTDGYKQHVLECARRSLLQIGQQVATSQQQQQQPHDLHQQLMKNIVLQVPINFWDGSISKQEVDFALQQAEEFSESNLWKLEHKDKKQGNFVSFTSRNNYAMEGQSTGSKMHRIDGIVENTNYKDLLHAILCLDGGMTNEQVNHLFNNQSKIDSLSELGLISSGNQGKQVKSKSNIEILQEFKQEVTAKENDNSAQVNAEARQFRQVDFVSRMHNASQAYATSVVQQTVSLGKTRSRKNSKTLSSGFSSTPPAAASSLLSGITLTADPLESNSVEFIWHTTCVQLFRDTQRYVIFSKTGPHRHANIGKSVGAVNSSSASPCDSASLRAHGFQIWVIQYLHESCARYTRISFVDHAHVSGKSGALQIKGNLIAPARLVAVPAPESVTQKVKRVLAQKGYMLDRKAKVIHKRIETTLNEMQQMVQAQLKIQREQDVITNGIVLSPTKKRDNCEEQEYNNLVSMLSKQFSYGVFESLQENCKTRIMRSKSVYNGNSSNIVRQSENCSSSNSQEHHIELAQTRNRSLSAGNLKKGFNSPKPEQPPMKRITCMCVTLNGFSEQDASSYKVSLVNYEALNNMARTNETIYKSLNITGTCVYSKGVMYQEIEGEANAVDLIFSKLLNEKRLRIISTREITIQKRQYDNWKFENKELQSVTSLAQSPTSEVSAVLVK